MLASNIPKLCQEPYHTCRVEIGEQAFTSVFLAEGRVGTTATQRPIATEALQVSTPTQGGFFGLVWFYLVNDLWQILMLQRLTQQ